MSHPPVRAAAARVAPLLGLALALGLAPAPASGAIRTQLGPGVTDRCPSADAIAERWRGRTSTDAPVELHVFADGERLVGIVRAAPEGQPPVARRLRARRDGCSALIDALLTSGALLVAPIELPPPPPPPPEPPPLAPPAPPTAAGSEPEPPAAPASGPVAGPWRLAVGARADVGSAPGASVSGEVRLAYRWPAATLGFGVQAGATGDAAVGAGAVSIERYAARGEGCWRPGSLGLCGFVRGGAVVLRPAGLDGGDAVELLADVGARAAWHIGMGDEWSLVVDAEAAAPLRPLRLTVDGAEAWQAAAVVVGGGLAVQWAP